MAVLARMTNLERAGAAAFPALRSGGACTWPGMWCVCCL
jgi:hypothetical protein